MISEKERPLSSVPSTDSCLISAQVEGTTLSQAQYDAIFSLTCATLLLPTDALEYVGYTSCPLTLHWHIPAGKRKENKPYYSIGLLSAMSQAGIKTFRAGGEAESVILQTTVRLLIILYVFNYTYIYTGGGTV